MTILTKLVSLALVSAAIGFIALTGASGQLTETGKDDQPGAISKQLETPCTDRCSAFIIF